MKPVTPLHILFVTNASTERCGVREYGDQMIAAIRRAGHHVDVWDGTYSSVYSHGYLPMVYATPYDLVHLNWDPQAINHYLPQHFTEWNETTPLSLFLHDVPPNSSCPVEGIAKWKFAFEPMDGAQVVPEAIPETPPYLLYGPQSWVPLIGVTGIRSDVGMDMVQNVCAKNGWILNAPLWWNGGPWLSAEDEIRRLATSRVNVCWYHTSGRGKSMAAAFCCAARRPLILSGSSMFSALWDYGDELYIARTHGHLLEPPSVGYTEETLEAVIKMVIEDSFCPKKPDRVCDRLSWDRVIQPIIAAWQDGLR